MADTYKLPRGESRFTFTFFYYSFCSSYRIYPAWIGRFTDLRDPPPPHTHTHTHTHIHTIIPWLSGREGLICIPRREDSRVSMQRGWKKPTKREKQNENTSKKGENATGNTYKKLVYRETVFHIENVLVAFFERSSPSTCMWRCTKTLSFVYTARTTNEPPPLVESHISLKENETW